MNYILKNLTNYEMKEFLRLFSEITLCNPISKNPNNFEKYTKGFRANKLPRHVLNRIYYDYINNYENSLLKQYLITNIKNIFKKTKIEELVDSVNVDNAINVAPKIEQEILKAGVSISPKQIFILAGYDLSETNSIIMEYYHQLILSENQRIQRECENKLNKVHKAKYLKLNSKYEKCLSDLNIERNRIKDITYLDKQKDLRIEERDNENNLIKEKISNLTFQLNKLKEKIQDYDAKHILLIKLEKENIDLKKQVEELKTNNEKLEVRALPSDIVKKLSLEVLEDLKVEDIGEDDFIKKASNIFNSDETLGESWKKLSENENNKLSIIIKKMENELVCNEDIDILDSIENCIYYKYMIVKGLKIIFYRFLEQNLGEQTINKKFYER